MAVRPHTLFFTAAEVVLGEGASAMTRGHSATVLIFNVCKLASAHTAHIITTTEITDLPVILHSFLPSFPATERILASKHI